MPHNHPVFPIEMTLEIEDIVRLLHMNPDGCIVAKQEAHARCGRSSLSQVLTSVLAGKRDFLLGLLRRSEGPIVTSESVFDLRRAPEGALRILVLPPGEKDDAYHLYEDWDVLVLASSTEPLQRLLAEAHAT